MRTCKFIDDRKSFRLYLKNDNSSAWKCAAEPDSMSLFEAAMLAVYIRSIYLININDFAARGPAYFTNTTSQSPENSLTALWILLPERRDGRPICRCKEISRH